MKLVLLSLLFSVSVAILRYPTPDFDFDKLAREDPREAARVSWMFIRDRRVHPFTSCNMAQCNGGFNGSKSTSFKSRGGLFSGNRKN